MTNFLQREFKSKPQVRGQFPERPDERGADDHDRGSAYISPWELLSAATERVMGATGAREMRCEPTSAEPSPVEPSKFTAN